MQVTSKDGRMKYAAEYCDAKFEDELKAYWKLHKLSDMKPAWLRIASVEACIGVYIGVYNRAICACSVPSMLLACS